MALVSFLKLAINIKCSKKLHEFEIDKDLLEKEPEYKIKLGFSLHVGWAIEGAIGSDFKIDASYLSPHVNLVV